MTYLPVNGAELYGESVGTGEPLLLLHGGFHTLEPLRSYAATLAERFTVYSYERPGHGRSADVDGPYSYEASAVEAAAYLDALGLESAHVVGYSDGASIGLLLAMRYPERVRSLVSISGNLDPDGFASHVDDVEGWSLAGEAGDGKIDVERDQYAALSPDGPAHVDVILAKLRDLWTTEPRIAPTELAAIEARTLVISGDRDTIRIDHSQLIARSIPRGELCIIPGTTHSLVEQKPALILDVIRHFHESLV